MTRWPNTEPVPEQSDPSIGQLVASIKDDVTGLVRGEVEMAKAELRAEAKAAGLGSAMVAVAAFLGLFALGLLTIALVYAVDALWLTRGWAFLAVGVLYLVVAGLLGLAAKGRFATVKGPQRTRASAERAAQALRPRAQP